MTAIQFKADFDSSLDSEYKREFNSEDIKLAPVLVLEVIYPFTIFLILNTK